jgi:hypothetical protein
MTYCLGIKTHEGLVLAGHDIPLLSYPQRGKELKRPDSQMILKHFDDYEAAHQTSGITTAEFRLHRDRNAGSTRIFDTARRDRCESQ